MSVDEQTLGTRARPAVSLGLFTGLTVAATGGPLALAALYLPGVLADVTESSGLVILLGAALFVPALVVWLRYSREVVGSGGLFGFVEAAAGRRVAVVQAGLWIVSYLLYLVYTITSIAYDLLPAVFPTLESVRPELQVVTAVVIAAVALAPLRLSLTVVTGVAAIQVLLLLALAAVGLTAQLAPSGASAQAAQPGDVLVAAGNTSILFICASLPLFLGGETRGGSRTVRRGLAVGWTVAVAATAVAAVPLARAGGGVMSAELPGMQLASAAGDHALAVAVGLGVVLSVAGVVVAEFLALTRLAQALSHRSVPQLSRFVAAALVVGASVSLVAPERIYTDLLKPSLVALWLSQLVVFVVYPRFAARSGRVRVLDVALAAAASALMLFGLHSTIVNQLGS